MSARRTIVAAALVAAAAASGVVAQTEASWVAPQAATTTVSAGHVAAPVTSCQGRNAAPNVLHLTPADEGVEVTEYAVTLTPTTEATGWDTGRTAEGYLLIQEGAEIRVPADEQAVAWGITGGWNHTWEGDITVRAVSASGWESDSVRYTWTIGFDILGIGYGSCTAG